MTALAIEFTVIAVGG